MNETYERILKRIKSEGQLRDALLILQCLCFATRPLKLPEIVEILAVDSESSGEFSEGDRLQDHIDVRSICSSLILLTEVRDPIGGADAKYIEVTLNHSTVREYLSSKASVFASDFEPDPGHISLARSCLIYLLDICYQLPLTNQITENRPFGLYAYANWWQHLGEINREIPKELTDMAKVVIRNESRLFGLVKVVDAQVGCHGYPLQMAAYRGHKGGTEVLLKLGVAVNAESGSHGSALQAAAWKGRSEVMQILLRYGADVNATGGNFGTALLGAAARGHKEAVRILLESGADVNDQSGGYPTPLHIAQSKGYDGMTRLLQARGAVAKPHQLKIDTKSLRP